MNPSPFLHWKNAQSKLDTEQCVGREKTQLIGCSVNRSSLLLERKKEKNVIKNTRRRSKKPRSSLRFTCHRNMAEGNTSATGRRRMLRSCVLLDYGLVWVDGSFDELDGDCQNTLQRLRAVFNNVKVFTDSKACVDFLNSIGGEKMCVITTGTLGQDLVPQIHSMPQVDAVYILCSDPDWNEPWTKNWPKIKGVHTQIESICNALQQSVKQCSQDSTPMSFVSADVDNVAVNLKQLEPSFMYTQIFKRILLDMEHDESSRKDLMAYCRKQKKDQTSVPKVIDEFDREYRPDKAIWWYTRECFTYTMLNKALRLLESDIIVDMGFFIHDIHRQIEQLHREQVAQYDGSVLTLYRGQGLSTADFAKLKRIKDGLLSFNSFVSTTRDRVVAEFIADSSSKATDGVGILFVMTVDTKLTSTPFADITGYSYFDEEEAEVLFSMHSVFRVDQVEVLEGNDRLIEVRLTLTADDDPQLRLLTETIDQEINGSTGWQRTTE